MNNRSENSEDARFQPSTAIFWDVTQRTLAVTEISGQPIGPICLTFEDWIDMLYRNVGNYQSTSRNTS
jgi:hypothetical protein